MHFNYKAYRELFPKQKTKKKESSVEGFVPAIEVREKEKTEELEAPEEEEELEDDEETEESEG